MHTLFGKRIRARLLPVVMAGALTACTSDISQDGPILSEGSLVVEPASISFSVGPAVGCLGTTTHIERYIITTFNPQGQPIGDADLEISLTFADFTTIAGLVVTELVDGDSGAIVSTSANPLPYETKTGELGTKTMFVNYEVTGGCQYAGNIMVNSGSVVTFSSFEFTD